ncbi:MAG TPA: L,D-transpeptidase [Longimicrobiaceae bacterium]|nr:L,D-transpeptidase [Longimicrobiaceae bacterium]
MAGALITGAALLTTACTQTADAESTLASRAANAGQPARQQVAVAATRPAATTPAAPAAKPAAPAAPLRLEVNIARRRLYVYRGDERIESHPIAVGTKSWPTQTGSWTVGQVVWNPRWIPPREQSWAEDREGKEPGAPDNPLGRAQLVYDAPRSIHGTNVPETLGTAASHGSIRIANRDAIHLAKLVMEEGGAGKDPAWYKRVQSNRKQRVNVGIPHPIPIRVVSGRAASSGSSASHSSASGR